MLEKKDEDYKLLYSKFTPLNHKVDKLTETVEVLKDENADLRKQLKQKDQQLQELDLLKYQIEQMQRVVYRSTSEKFTPGQLALGKHVVSMMAKKLKDTQSIKQHQSRIPAETRYLHIYEEYTLK